MTQKPQVGWRRLLLEHLAGRYVGPQTLLSGSTENKKKWSKTRNILGHHIWSDQFCHALRAKPCWKSWHSANVQSWHSHRGVSLMSKVWPKCCRLYHHLSRLSWRENVQQQTSFQTWLIRLSDRRGKVRYLNKFSNLSVLYIFLWCLYLSATSSWVKVN